MSNALTAKQAELWKVSDEQLKAIGGAGSISRNPDKAIRTAGKTEGTREWALLESTRLASPANNARMTDDYCQQLLNILLGK